MRVRSHWFKTDRPKSADEVAGAAAVIAWKVAQNALTTMRAAGFELVPGPRYFAFIEEFLAFLVVGGDRIAYARGDEAWRVAMVTWPWKKTLPRRWKPNGSASSAGKRQP